MEQDLRELFKNQRGKEQFSLKDGHEKRFLKSLEASLPREKKKNRNWLKIAATVLIVLSLGLGYQYSTIEEGTNPTIVFQENSDATDTEFSFGDLSPELKNIEEYYVANINMELAKLEVAPDTKDLVDSFMEQLSSLNAEYTNLNTELKELGPNDQTIAALIENLQLRLQLLQKLKKKLNELKLSKNEQIKKNSI